MTQLLVHVDAVDSPAVFELSRRLGEQPVRVLGRIAAQDPQLREWMLAHPDVARFAPAPRARPRRRDIPRRIRETVYRRDGRRCLFCGRRDRLSLDHIVPYSHGGPDTEDNLRTLCVPCNSGRRPDRG